MSLETKLWQEMKASLPWAERLVNLTKEGVPDTWVRVHSQDVAIELKAPTAWNRLGVRVPQAQWLLRRAVAGGQAGVLARRVLTSRGGSVNIDLYLSVNTMLAALGYVAARDFMTLRTASLQQAWDPDAKNPLILAGVAVWSGRQVGEQQRRPDWERRLAPLLS